MGVLLALILGAISFYYYIKLVKAFQAFSWQGAIKKKKPHPVLDKIFHYIRPKCRVFCNGEMYLCILHV